MVGPSSNKHADGNIKKILELWRSNQRKIIHVQHESTQEGSMFQRKMPGFRFKPYVDLDRDDVLIQKSALSGFADGNLQKLLLKLAATDLIVMGFSLNHCLDATIRWGADLGFKIYLITDASAAFPKWDESGQLLTAGDIHRVCVANLSREFAVPLRTIDVADWLAGH